MAGTIVELKHVSKAYGNEKVVDDVSLRIDTGEIFALIGPSGCGKTTTLKMINQLIPHSTGEIFVKGQDVTKFDPVELRRSIGYVIQYVGLLPHLTIRDNISFVLQLKKQPKKKQRERAEELIQTVGLPVSYLDRHPRELSGGQQQRVGVARALAADPEILLMDEPFGAVDPVTREQLQNELLRLQETINKTIIFVTHDMQEAFKVGSRLGLMNKGKLVSLGTAMDVLREDNDFVRTFIGQGAVFNALDALPVSRTVNSTVPKIYEDELDQQQVVPCGWENIFVLNRQGHCIGYLNFKQPGVLPLPPSCKLDLTIKMTIEKMLWSKRTWLPVETNEGVFLGITTFEACSTLLDS